MVKEIYIRTPEDPEFVPGIIDYSNEIEQVISQMRMILGTNHGEVIGTYDFGLDLEYLIFKTKVSAEDIRKKILDQLSMYAYISPNLSVDVTVSFGKSEYGYDYALVDVTVNGTKAIGFLIDKD